MAFAAGSKGFSNFAKGYLSSEDDVAPIAPGQDFSTSGIEGVGRNADRNYEMGMEMAGSSLNSLAKKKQADDLVAIYKEQASKLNAKKNGAGGFLGGLLGIGSTIASFIPGGGAIAKGLGAVGGLFG